jgi:VanZ family protein
MIIKTLSEPNKNSFWTAFFWTLLILFLSFKSPSNVPNITIQNADKVVHFMFYFVFVFLWYRYLFFIKKTKKMHVFILSVVAITIGILVEIGQGYFTATRQSDVFDIVANSLGTIAGIFVSFALLNKERTK